FLLKTKAQDSQTAPPPLVVYKWLLPPNDLNIPSFYRILMYFILFYLFICWSRVSRIPFCSCLPTTSDLRENPHLPAPLAYRADIQYLAILYSATDCREHCNFSGDRPHLAAANEIRDAP